VFRTKEVVGSNPAVAVDAKDDEAATFYKRYGFALLPSQSNRLFLPMSSMNKMFKQEAEKVSTPAKSNRS